MKTHQSMDSLAIPDGGAAIPHRQITFQYREMTRDGVWVSPLHQAPNGAFGESQMRQGVIGGFVSSPRCVVSNTGFFYGLGEGGKEIDRAQAFALGLIEGHHLHVEEVFNDQLVKEVRFCRYAQYEAAVKACDVKLTVRLGKTEHDVLARIKSSDGEAMPDVSCALLFGALFRGFSKPHLAALVKLTRRGVVKFYRFYGNEDGYMLRLKVDDGGQS